MVKGRSGAGDGAAVAGIPEEKALANYIEQEMKEMGLRSSRSLLLSDTTGMGLRR